MSDKLTLYNKQIEFQSNFDYVKQRHLHISFQFVLPSPTIWKIKHFNKAFLVTEITWTKDVHSLQFTKN